MTLLKMKKGVSLPKFKSYSVHCQQVIAWTKKIRKITEQRMGHPFCLTKVVYQYGRTDIIICFDTESVSKSIYR